MRAKVGEIVELVNGRGILAHAKIQNLGRREAELEVTELLQTAEAPTWKLVLCQAFPRANRLATILEKGTELGMTNCLLFPGDLSEVSSHSESRARNTCIAASKQCGRLFVPEISILPALSQWKEWPKEAFFGDLDPNAPLLREKLSLKPKDIYFFIGPEKGFSEREETILREHDVLGVKLHDNILRTDTAPLLVLSVLSHH